SHYLTGITLRALPPRPPAAGTGLALMWGERLRRGVEQDGKEVKWVSDTSRKPEKKARGRPKRREVKRPSLREIEEQLKR
ncbi:hypothetical protein ACFL01_03545, partial [Planctomycetota bacterium]